jgi:diguanylate cyclase
MECYGGQPLRGSCRGSGSEKEEQMMKEREGDCQLTLDEVEDKLEEIDVVTFQKTVLIAPKVFAFMVKREIPITPENYKVWFEYHIGDNEELERDVKAKKNSGTLLNSELTRDLYDKYFRDADRVRIVSLIENNAVKIMKDLIISVLSNLRDTSEYNKKLGQYSRSLSSVNEIEEVKQIISDIIIDTKKVEESNVELQSKIEIITVEAENLKKQIEQNDRDLLKDPLTGLFNRRALSKKLKELYNDFKRNRSIFSVIMTDINSFKQFNDQYGHMIGDEALQIVSATLEENTKGKDFVGRYGGDEFILLLPMTTLYSASIVADNLGKAVSKRKLTVKSTGKSIDKLTISLGVSQIHEDDTTDSVIERADAALALAKKTKLDRVKSEKDLSQLTS